MRGSPIVATLSLGIVVAIGAVARPALAYHVFDPRPSQELRELATDRPDKTESPYTVDAGHAQVEVDVVGYTYDRNTASGADEVVQQWSVCNTNYKAGLLPHVDLQVVVESFSHQRTEDRTAGTTETRQGFGDITPRLKINLWGNDGGRTAAAIMPFVKIPTNRHRAANDAVEGGVILPLAMELPAGFGMGLMTQVDFNRNDADTGYHAEFINTATVAHDLIGPLAGYVEFFSQVSNEAGSEWVGTIDAGLTYGVTDNLQLDAGVNVGVTKSADTINPFLGLAVRF